jgi:hypothetical protein
MAGVIMPADLLVGLSYRQEQLPRRGGGPRRNPRPGRAGRGAVGSFEGVVMTKDTTPLEPKILEHKFYARGVGPVLVLAISGGGGREELISFHR